jgi:hypothetical protein
MNEQMSVYRPQRTCSVCGNEVTRKKWRWKREHPAYYKRRPESFERWRYCSIDCWHIEERKRQKEWEESPECQAMEAKRLERLEKRQKRQEERGPTDAMIIRAENAGRELLAWEQIKDRAEPLVSQIFEVIDTLDPDERTDAEFALTTFIDESREKRFEKRSEDKHGKRIDDRHPGEEEES